MSITMRALLSLMQLESKAFYKQSAPPNTHAVNNITWNHSPCLPPSSHMSCSSALSKATEEEDTMHLRIDEAEIGTDS